MFSDPGWIIQADICVITRRELTPRLSMTSISLTNINCTWATTWNAQWLIALTWSQYSKLIRWFYSTFVRSTCKCFVNLAWEEGIVAIPDRCRFHSPANHVWTSPESERARFIQLGFLNSSEKIRYTFAGNKHLYGCLQMRLRTSALKDLIRSCSSIIRYTPINNIKLRS